MTHEDTTRPDNSDDLTKLTSGISYQSGGAGDAAVEAGTVLGSYTIESVIGQGGMGAVYRATQSSPNRTVALKIMKPGLCSAKALRRFELESQLLGRLSHPGIASVFEAGLQTDRYGNQIPFFAMEFIDGPTLLDYTISKNLTIKKRLELFAQICDAVHHAHTKGIIHRDLKPANILVATVSGKPIPKVLDFGVARSTDSDVVQATMQTEVGQIVGTIPYMSPEQVAGDPDDIDTRSDVYALGVVLYELLADRLPYDLQRTTIHEAARVIREDEPARLSTIKSGLRGDIETVVTKTLEKDPERRYQSAMDCASDIRRYLANEPISARPPSGWYQFTKFTKRNKVLVVGVASAFVALAVGLIGTTYGLIEADAARAEEAKRASELELVTKFQDKQLADIDPPAMGIMLREGLLKKFRARNESAGYGEAEIEQRLANLVESLNGVDFTGLALEALEENIFDRAITAIDEQFGDQPLMQARLLLTISETTQDIGLVDLMQSTSTRALELRRNTLGDDDPETLSAMSAVAAALQIQGDYEQATELYLKAIESARRVLGDTDQTTLELIYSLSTLYIRQNKLLEAEPLLREALELRRSVHGDEHELTINAIDSMGVLLRMQGKYEDAESFGRDALELSRQVNGLDHNRTLITLNNLAMTLMEQGKFTEAEPLFIEGLETCRRVLGDEHPDTVTAINNMGMLRYNQGDYQGAEPYFRESLRAFRTLLGSDHPSTKVAIQNLGFSLWGQYKFAEAEPYFIELFEINRRQFGAQDPQTIQTLKLIIEANGNLHEQFPEAGYDRTAAQYQAQLDSILAEQETAEQNNSNED